MNLEEIKKIKESLEELTPDVESFSWGPSYEFAVQRKKEALKILNREIRTLKESVKTGSSAGEQVMPKVNGVSFRCECGCNVFTKLDENHYSCNSCELEYEGS